jgi:hypothetical protein
LSWCSLIALRREPLGVELQIEIWSLKLGGLFSTGRDRVQGDLTRRASQEALPIKRLLGHSRTLVSCRKRHDKTTHGAQSRVLSTETRLDFLSWLLG